MFSQLSKNSALDKAQQFARIWRTFFLSIEWRKENFSKERKWLWKKCCKAPFLDLKIHQERRNTEETWWSGKRRVCWNRETPQETQKQIKIPVFCGLWAMGDQMQVAERATHSLLCPHLDSASSKPIENKEDEVRRKKGMNREGKWRKNEKVR